MFKKTLVALALTTTTLCANAGTIKTNVSSTKNVPFAVSNQGLPLTGEYNIAAGANRLEVGFTAAEGAALKTGNFLAITVTGAYFADYEVSGVAYSNAAGTGVANNGITLTHVQTASSRKNSATKLYLETVGTAPTTVTTFSLDDLNLQVIPGATSIEFTVAVENESGIVVTGTQSAATTVANLQDQWSLTVKGLDAQIDVANDRKTFVGNLTTDAIVLDHTLNGTGTNATANSYKITVKGDFTGIEKVVGTSGAFAINTAKTEASKTITVGAAALTDETITFTLDSGTKAVAQAERSFTADIEVTYDTTKSFVLGTGTKVGGWTLNSSSTTINYAPMGPNTQLIVNATSVFKEDASVDVSYLAADGKMKLLEDVATVKAKTVTKLGDVISSKVLADMGTTSGKTKLVVSVNAPDGNVTFFTGFKDKVDGSRMALQQVDTVANATLAAAEAAKNDLANTTDGLGVIQTAVAANTTANKLAAVNASLAALNTAALGAGSLLENGTSGNWATGAAAVLDGICGTMNGDPAGSTYDVDTTATSGTPVADAAAVAGAVCVKQ